MSTDISSLQRIPSPSELLVQARTLSSLLYEQAAETERTRTLSSATIQTFKQARFFQVLQPARFGGLEMGFDVLMDIAIELGKGCGSSAWVCVVLNSGWLVAGYPVEAQYDVWNDHPDAIIGNVLAPSIDITPVAEGYRVSGKWSFASGIDHSDWHIVSGLVLSEGRPPEIKLFLLPRRSYEIVDDWHTVGLRGTGSRTIVARDVFVPHHRAVSLADFRTGTQPGADVNPNPIYRVPLGVLFPILLASPIVGVALGAYARWRQWTETRLTQGIQRVAEQIPTQMRLAEAAVEIDAAELLLRRDMTETMQMLATGEPFTLWHRARSRRDGAYAIELCVRAIDRLFAASGGRGLYDDNPIHRAWRDVHAAAAHITYRWDGAATVFGRIEFGLGFDNPFFD